MNITTPVLGEDGEPLYLTLFAENECDDDEPTNGAMILRYGDDVIPMLARLNYQNACTPGRMWSVTLLANGRRVSLAGAVVNQIRNQAHALADPVIAECKARQQAIVVWGQTQRDAYAQYQGSSFDRCKYDEAVGTLQRLFPGHDFNFPQPPERVQQPQYAEQPSRWVHEWDELPTQRRLTSNPNGVVAHWSP